MVHIEAFNLVPLEITYNQKGTWNAEVGFSMISEEGFECDGRPHTSGFRINLFDATNVR